VGGIVLDDYVINLFKPFGSVSGLFEKTSDDDDLHRAFLQPSPFLVDIFYFPAQGAGPLVKESRNFGIERKLMSISGLHSTFRSSSEICKAWWCC
jgi:hypothetical protein